MYTREEMISEISRLMILVYDTMAHEEKRDLVKVLTYRVATGAQLTDDELRNWLDKLYEAWYGKDYVSGRSTFPP